MIGETIKGRYRVLTLIGSGGMANVYTAFDLQTKRTVAFKVLKKEFAEDAEFVRRFEHEATAVLMLSHDNIVHPIDVGEDGDMHYIVLEYVEGKSLKEIIRGGGPMDVRKAVHIATQVCDALTHAHERNIIHRDVKPQNILVNLRGKARLTDFGIARDASATTMTFTGNNIMGSVHYLSPEQARGEPVDAQSDIYSLGITLYEMVVGAVPFEAESSVSVALKHLQEDITPPRDIIPTIPRSVNDIILRATQKDKSLRYASARAMKADLLRALREPEGKFAAQTTLAAVLVQNRAKRTAFNVLRIALGGIVAIGLLLVMFFIGRNLTTPSAQKNYIPRLTGRTITEAISLAERLGFSVEVTERMPDEGNARDVVRTQSPESGTVARGGETIYVTVSDGPTQITAPKLIDLSLEEAKRILEVEGFTLGSVNYEISDVPEGYITRQDPAPNESMVDDEVIDIWISGNPIDTIEMPSLTDLSLEDAMIDAQNLGFDQFLVRETETKPGEQENVVLSQIPSAGEPAPAGTVVELWVRAKVQYDFEGNVAFNVDIEANDTLVEVILVQNANLRYILFENKLPAGKQTVPLTIRSNDNSDKTVIVKVNGQEIRRENVIFSPRR